MKKFCRKHKIFFEDTEVLTIGGKCPICFYGKPNNQPEKYYRKEKQSPTYTKIPIATQDLKKFLEGLDKCYLSRRKTKEDVAYKKGVIKALREQFGLSFPKIAKTMGYKDHTTPHHLYTKMKSTSNEK